MLESSGGEHSSSSSGFLSSWPDCLSWVVYQLDCIFACVQLTLFTLQGHLVNFPQTFTRATPLPLYTPAPLGHSSWVCTERVCPSPQKKHRVEFSGLIIYMLFLSWKKCIFFQVVLGPDHTLGSVHARCWNSNHSALLWLLWACHLQKTTNQWKTTFPWFSSSIKLLSSANIISRHSWTKIYLSSNKWHHIFFPNAL